MLGPIPDVNIWLIILPVADVPTNTNFSSYIVLVLWPQCGSVRAATRDSAGSEGPRICSLLPHGHNDNTKKLKSAGHFRCSGKCSAG